MSAQTSPPIFEFLETARIMLMYWREGSIPDECWDEYVAKLAAESARMPPTRVLTWNTGAPPTRHQVMRLVRQVGGAQHKVALVGTPPGFVLAVVALANRHVRAFSEEELPGAYRHLQLTLEERAAVDRGLARLREQPRSRVAG